MPLHTTTDSLDRNLHEELRKLQDSLLDSGLTVEAAERLAAEVARLRGMERKFSVVLDQLREVRDELSIELASLERILAEALRVTKGKE